MNTQEHGGQWWQLWLSFMLLITGFLVILVHLHHVTHPTWEPPLTPRLALRPRAGLNLPPEALDTPRFLRDVAESGVLWIRVEIPWSEIEPIPGQYRWAEWDRRVQNVEQAGLYFIALLNTSPSWARSQEDADNPLAPPSDPQTMAHFARAFASRYREHVRYYQVWDEPNISPHWGHRETDPLGYVYLLKSVSTAIRAVDEDAVILSAGLAPTLDPGRINRNDLAYLRELYTLGANMWFDVLAWEPYGFDYPPEEPPDENRLNFRRYELARAIMQEFGDDETPIWFVAFGWNASSQGTPWKEVSRAQQAEYLRRAYQWVKAHAPYVGPMLWTHARPALPSTAPEWGFALWSPNGRPQPAWASLQSIAELPSMDVGTHKLQHNFPPITLSFWGSAVALEVQAGPRWDIVWVSIDGQPAPLLPKDAQGRAYLNLYRPHPTTLVVPLAYNLTRRSHVLTVLQGPGDPIWPLKALIVPLPGHGDKRQVFFLVLGFVLMSVALYRIRFGYIRFPLIVPCSPPTKFFMYSVGSIIILAPFASQYVRIGPWVVAPPVLGGLAAGVAFVTAWFKSGVCLKWHWGRWDWMVGLGVFISVLGVAVMFGETSWGIFWTRVGVPFVVFVIVILFGIWGEGSQWATRIPSLLTTTFTVSGTLLALTNLIYLFDGQPPFRLRGFFGSPNHLALILVRILPLALIHARAGTGHIKAKISVLLIGVTLVLTGSRSVWLLGIPALILALGFTSAGKTKGLSLAFLVGGIFMIWRGGTTLQHRWLIWRGTWTLIKHHPWLGVGVGNFPQMYPMYALPSAWREPLLYHAHNVLLHTAAEIGIPGTLAFAYLLFQALRRPSSTRISQAAKASLLAGLACGLVDAFWALDDLAYLTALTWAFLYLPKESTASPQKE